MMQKGDMITHSFHGKINGLLENGVLQVENGDVGQVPRFQLAQVLHGEVFGRGRLEIGEKVKELDGDVLSQLEEEAIEISRQVLTSWYWAGSSSRCSTSFTRSMPVIGPCSFLLLPLLCCLSALHLHQRPGVQPAGDHGQDAGPWHLPPRLRGEGHRRPGQIRLVDELKLTD